MTDCDFMPRKEKLVRVARLYMKVCHAIQISNLDNKCPHEKRNRKMLKLLHLLVKLRALEMDQLTDLSLL